jgi:hypothetical protein
MMDQTAKLDTQVLWLRRPFFPHGGSVQARCFASPRAVPLRGAACSAWQHATCGLDGTLTLHGGPDCVPAAAFALAAGAPVSLGAFLDGALPGIAAAAPHWPDAYLAAAPPTPAQLAVLERLELAERVWPLLAPAAFQTGLLCDSGPAHGIPEPAPYLALMHRLRAELAPTVPFAVALLPSLTGQRFALRNRASLSAWLRARRFALLAPESDEFERTAAALARATLVLIADPKDAGLLGLCSPGAKILEIAPEGWASGKIRGLCEILGLRHALFLAAPPSYPLLRSLPFGAAAALSYDISIAALGQVLRVV